MSDANAEVSVTFHPSGKTVHVLRGTTLMEAAALAGLALDLPCGGEGTCGKCRVEVRTGRCEPTAAETQHLDADELGRGVRLACQSAACEATVVDVPETSLLASSYKILSRVRKTATAETDPAVAKRYCELPKPGRGQDEPDMVRLEEALGPVQVDLELVRRVPELLRGSDFRVTAAMIDDRLIDLEPGDTSSEMLAAAVDVGTTTLAVRLVDLCSGQPLGVTTRLNPQTAFGDDVVSRIVHAGSSAGGLEELHEAVVDAVDEMIGQLVAESGHARERIYEVTVAGNTTMQQLFSRIDPKSLGEIPFVPTVGRHLRFPARQVGLRIHPRGCVYVTPVIGGFVGGDTVAGILASGMLDAEGPALLVDIGTNGEIVLRSEGKLQAAATAAGPAFEGARISRGMRASVGAIEKVVVDGHLRINVIGTAAPSGLCGSALIDLAAELLRHGVLGPDGRLRPPDELPPGTLGDLSRRIVAEDDKPAFLLADDNQTSTGRRLTVTQRDFRELQLASGAIRAGVSILLRRAGLRAEQLETVYVAGGFGNFVRRKNAQRIGLLPPEIPRNRIRYQGNTALAGANLAALSKQARQLADSVAREVEHVDLSTDPAFQEAFAEAMIFPEGAA
jgi:uncharacterized 2Fe-2S/4Fe-4S cluster protein (DUF4445 family)